MERARPGKQWETLTTGSGVCGHSPDSRTGSHRTAPALWAPELASWPVPTARHAKEQLGTVPGRTRPSDGWEVCLPWAVLGESAEGLRELLESVVFL